MRTEDNQITGRKKKEEERCDKIIGSNNRWRWQREKEGGAGLFSGFFIS